jgi:hypothetical protein
VHTTLVSQIDPCTSLLPTPLPGHRRGLGTVPSKQDADLGWVTGPVARRANLHASHVFGSAIGIHERILKDEQA